MRSKLNASLGLVVLGLFSVATACGDDTGTGSPGKGEAGESGAASGGDSPVGSAGSATAGKGGSLSVNGGNPSSDGGDPSVNGGNASVKGGESSAGGNPSGNGGDPSGNGGDPSGSGGAAAGAGGDGPVTCTPITLGQFQGGDIDPSFATYVASFTPNIVGLGADTFQLAVQAPPLYNGGATGTFDLTENGDENYATCARCILVIADPNGDRTVFYPSEGTLEIDAASKQLGGTIDATVSNLTLVEVTIANDYTSTPVANGRCLTVASADIVVTAPPCAGFECTNGYCLADPTWQCDNVKDCSDESDEDPLNPNCAVPIGWVCPESYYGDGDCDCGCGDKDLDCIGTANEAECDYCSECSGNFQPCAAGNVDPADTTMCL